MLLGCVSQQRVCYCACLCYQDVLLSLLLLTACVTVPVTDKSMYVTVPVTASSLYVTVPDNASSTNRISVCECTAVYLH